MPKGLKFSGKDRSFFLASVVVIEHDDKIFLCGQGLQLTFKISGEVGTADRNDVNLAFRRLINAHSVDFAFDDEDNRVARFKQCAFEVENFFVPAVFFFV